MSRPGDQIRTRFVQGAVPPVRRRHGAASMTRFTFRLAPDGSGSASARVESVPNTKPARNWGRIAGPGAISTRRDRICVGRQSGGRRPRSPLRAQAAARRMGRRAEDDALLRHVLGLDRRAATMRQDATAAATRWAPEPRRPTARGPGRTSRPGKLRRWCRPPPPCLGRPRNSGVPRRHRPPRVPGRCSRAARHRGTRRPRSGASGSGSGLPPPQRRD